MGRTRTVIVAAVVSGAVLTAGACKYESSDDADEAAGGAGDAGAAGAADDDPTSASVRSTTADPRRLVATGEPVDVCTAAVGELGDDVSIGSAPPRVLAEAAFEPEQVRWVICAGVPGGPAGVVSLRSVAEGEWAMQQLPISNGGQDGDELVATIADPARAWATQDGVASGGHEHLWTVDGGTTWHRIFPGA